MTEKQLRERFKSILPKRTHFQPLETHVPGVPDLNFCLEGQEHWVELKIVTGQRKLKFQKPLSSLQWNWLRARVKAGGNAWIVGQHEREIWIWDCSEALERHKNSRAQLPSNPCYRFAQAELQAVASLFVQKI